MMKRRTTATVAEDESRVGVPTVTVSRTGRVLIPIGWRRKYGLRAGVRVTIVDQGGVLELIRHADHRPPESQPLRSSRKQGH